MGREQLLPHLLVINLLLLFLQKGERLFVANSMPILLKHLMLRSLDLGPRSLPPRTLSTPQEGRELPLPSIPVGGRLSQFSTQWEKRTSDPWVRGIRTSVQTVTTSVGVSHSLFSLFGSSQTSTSVRGSVCSVTEGSNRTGSNFFPGSRILFPSLLGSQEKGGGMRPAIDLSILNTYLVVPHFKMGTNRSIRASILPGIWSTSLDLADAYFHCGFQEIPSLRVGQQSFSVSSSPIRVSHSSFGLHQFFSSCLS